MKTAYFVLGMHRSGTSALTGVIKNLGFELGSDLMKATEMNPKGYFENMLIFNLNEKILNEQNSSWDKIPFKLNSIEKNKKHSYLEEIKNLISSEFSKVDEFVIKDPRICLLFPLWEKACNDLDIKIKIVISYRNPLEVSKSLNKRNFFSFEKSMILWAIHVLNAEFFSRDYERIFISFDELINNTKNTIKIIKEFFSINPSHKQIEKIATFLDKDAKHYNYSYKDIPIDIPSFLKNVIFLFKDAKFKDLEYLDDLRNEFYNCVNVFYHKELIDDFEIAKVKDEEIKELQNKIQLLDKIKDVSTLDEEYYFNKNPDLKNFQGSLKDHFYNHGRSEGRRPNQYCEFFQINTKEITSKDEMLYYRNEQINKQNNKINLQENELNELNQKLQDFEKKLSESNQKQLSLLHTNESTINQNESLIELLKQKENKQKNSNHSHEQGLHEIKQLREKTLILEEKNRFLKKESKNNYSQIEEYSKIIKNLLKNYNNIYDTQEKYYRELKELKIEIKQVFAIVNENKTLIRDKNKTIENLNLSLESKNNEIRTLNQNHKNQEQKLINSINVKLTIIDDLKQELSKNKKQLETSMSSEQKTFKELTSSTEKLSQINRKLNLGNQQIENITMEKLEIENLLISKEAEVIKLNQDIDEIIKELLKIKESKYWKFLKPIRIFQNKFKDKK